VAQDLDPGVVYTLKITAYKTDPAIPAAEGSIPVTVLAGQAVSVTVPLILTVGQTSTGFLNYAVTLPTEITLTGGLLTLYPFSSGAASINIDLSGGAYIAWLFLHNK
jgi:hypothetical protein